MMEKSDLTGTGNKGGLLDQWKLLRAVIDARWATRLDVRVVSHVIQYHYKKFGGARLSLRFLEAAVRSSRTNIIASLRRLEKNLVLTVKRKGVGTRPTDYGLNFDFANGGNVDDTATSGNVDDTSTGNERDTSSASSGHADVTESYLRNRSTDRLTVSREGATAVPSAPRAAVLSHDAAGSAVVLSDFDKLWLAFPTKRDRSKAKDEFRQLAPNDELLALMIEKANELAHHYEKNCTPKRYRKVLHNWIREERYLEELTEYFDYQSDSEKAKSKNLKAANDNIVGLSPRTPIGDHTVEILKCEFIKDNSTTQRLAFRYRILDGKHKGTEFDHKFYIELPFEKLDEQLAGQEILRQIQQASGTSYANSESELVGKKLIARVQRMGRVAYAA